MIRNRRWGGFYLGVNTLVWSLSLSYSRYGSSSVSACLGPLWVSYEWGREKVQETSRWSNIKQGKMSTAQMERARRRADDIVQGTKKAAEDDGGNPST